MANRKISEFPSYLGEPSADIFFIAASGQPDNAASSNYKLSYLDLSSGVNHLINGDYSMPLSISGDYFSFQSKTNSPKKNFNFAIDSTGYFSIHSGSGSIFHEDVNVLSNLNLHGNIFGGGADFSGIVSVNGSPIVTGFDFSNDGESCLDGDIENFNLGGSLPNSAKNVNIRVSGQPKLTARQDGDIYISQDVLVHGGVKTEGDSSFGGQSKFYGLECTNNSLFSGINDFSDGLRVLPGPEPESLLENRLYNLDGSLKWQDTNIVTDDLLSDYLSSYISNDTFFGSLDSYLTSNDLPNYLYTTNSWYEPNSFLCPVTLGTYADLTLSFPGPTSESLPELVQVSAVTQGLLSVELIATGNSDNNINIVDSGGAFEIEYGALCKVSDLISAINSYQDGLIISSATEGEGETSLANMTESFGEGASINIIGKATFSSPVYINNELYIDGETYRGKIAELEAQINALEARITALE